MKKNDPETYAACAVPHESDEAAEAAMAAFLVDVSEARRKHRIVEVVIVADAAAQGHALRQVFEIGDQSRHPEMVAWAYRGIVAPLVAALGTGLEADDEA